MVMRLMASVCEHKTAGKVVLMAPDAATLRAQLATNIPDIILMDINLPDDDGIVLALSIRQQYPAIKVIMLTAESSEYTVSRVRQSGLNGYVDKGEDPSIILTAINEVLLGSGIFFSALGRQITQQTAVDQNSFAKILSNRELELMPLLGMGWSNEVIAQSLHSMPNTVAKHRYNIMSKLNISSTPALVHYCLEKGFIRARPEGGARPARASQMA